MLTEPYWVCRIVSQNINSPTNLVRFILCPCARVGREPLRKLEHNERVIGSLATLLKYSLPFDVVLKGAVLGYVYALEQGECEQQELLMHLQIQLRHIALEPQLYEMLYDEMVQFINQIIAFPLQVSDIHSYTFLS